MDIEVKIRGLMVDPNNHTPIIILKSVLGEELLPIWVGTYEANAIALEIEKVAAQRPMTHDLLRNIITQIGARVERVVVTELRENTFFSVVELITESGETIFLDARPSDAIALALRADCPIYVAAEVLRNSQLATEQENGGEEPDDAEDSVQDDEWPEVIGDLPM